jgi:alcohol dehydrogenase class IV
MPRETISLPRLVQIGGGALRDLPTALSQTGLSRPAIITDAFLAESSAFDELRWILKNASVEARFFTEAIPDPTVTSVDAAVAFINEGKHDCVVAAPGK